MAKTLKQQIIKIGLLNQMNELMPLLEDMWGPFGKVYFRKFTSL